jgi:membrane-bound lytic murein transglycosylase D
LEMPDLPVRWDERVVRYLLFFRDDPSGHATFANLYRHSGRWRDMIRRELRRKSLPEDLTWVSMIESGFDPVARSSAGARGLWQFMPETARLYGITIDRWMDQRLSPTSSTQAAVDFLADLHQRFGNWELALAGFNMGAVGLMSVLRRYNTNDFWSLARTEGTLPWETTLYVPKVLAAAVVARNLATFGFGDVAADFPVDTDDVEVTPGTPLSMVAQAAGVATKDIEDLNPELRAGRTPPQPPEGATATVVKVPQGKGAVTAQHLARLRRDAPTLERYVVRFGETLDQIALARKTTTQKLIELNSMAPGDAVRGGTVLMVPRSDAAPASSTSSTAPATKTSVVVPADLFVYPDHKRVFYRAIAGDTLGEVASALHVAADDLRRWNALDPSARLQGGMTLQAFVPTDADLSAVVVASEGDVNVLPVGSDQFFSSIERDSGMQRITVAARTGDTLETIGKRFKVTARRMEWINRRSRKEALQPGEAVVVYVAAGKPVARSGDAPVGNEPAPLGALPAPPEPQLLP